MSRKGDPGIEGRLPLKPREYWILLVLSESAKHGYAILKAAKARSNSELGLGPTTLYRMLYRMVDEGLVEAVEPPAEDVDERRQYYGLTATGRAVLAAEVKRLERMVELGRNAVAGSVTR